MKIQMAKERAVTFRITASVKRMEITPVLLRSFYPPTEHVVSQHS